MWIRWILLRIRIPTADSKPSHSWPGLPIPRSAGPAYVPGHRRRADKRGDGRGEAWRAHPCGHARQAHGHAQQEDDHAGRLQVGDQLTYDQISLWSG